jgi:hypothetical protein
MVQVFYPVWRTGRNVGPGKKTILIGSKIQGKASFLGLCLPEFLILIFVAIAKDPRLGNL